MVRRRYAVVFILVLVSALTIGQASAWSYTKPKRIPRFHVTRRLPRSMIASSAYEMSFTFSNPKRQKTSMTLMLEITEKDSIGFGEFIVEGTLEAYDSPHRRHSRLPIMFTETEGGIFQSRTPIQKRFNYVTLTISSVPNLMPGTYMFSLNVAISYGKK